MLQYLKKTYLDTFNPKAIPSLDGLRAFSIFLVLSGHYYLTKNFGPHTKFFIFHDLGVSLFFVISGFLITRILLKEYKEKGFISFKVFFIKRFFRIFPAYYFFLAVTSLALIFNGQPVDIFMLLSCFFYLGFYYPHELHAVWAHSWSLAIEEQFYLFWPALFQKFFNLDFIKKVTIGLILMAPLLRVTTYFFIPLYKHKYPFLLHTRVDTLMMGCLYALYFDSNWAEKLRRFCRRKKVFLISFIYLFVCYPVLHLYFLGKFRTTVGYTLEAATILFCLIYLMEVKDTWVYRALNSKLMTHLGTISYGLYLWQQPFTYNNSEWLAMKFPFHLLSIYLMTLLSFFMIEKPCLIVRDRVLQNHAMHK